MAQMSASQKPTLLLIEDDPDVRASLELALGFEGFAVLSAATGSDGLRRLLEEDIDAVLLDVLLPGADGYSVLAEIRAEGHPKRFVPVLMLTALDEVEDRVRGLRRGADDYLVKPFALAELVARVEALLRRRGEVDSGLRLGDLVLYPARMVAERSGRILQLAPKEFLLLKALADNAGRILSKDALLGQLWDEPVEANTLEAYVSSLRRALGEPPLIRTVRGYGYLLEPL